LTISSPIDRRIISLMEKDYMSLKDLREAIEQNKKDVFTKKQISFTSFKSSQNICKGILQGLTKSRIEFRVRELEEKLANGVLIPKHE